VRNETFTTPGPTALAVRIPSGTIAVEARPGADTTEVEFEVLNGDAELENMATIELRERGGSFEVAIESPRRRFGFGRESYRVAVSLPEGADVETSTGSADVRATGRYGRFAAKSGSGEVEVDEVGGDLEVKVASGDITAEAVGGRASVNSASGDIRLGKVAGEGRIRSASGDVEVREAESGLSINTASGDQTIGSAASGELTLRSASGDVHVGIRQGSRVFVDARSAAGDMESELELGDAPSSGDGPLVEVNATTASGDVRIVRA
jgi:DUF4097 and DUF4098 domain-containing protein YvlB